MYPVSAAYRRAMRQQVREAQAHARIYMGVFDATASSDAAFAFSPKTKYSKSENINADAGITASYATFETDRLRLNGKHLLLPDAEASYFAQGFISAAQSGAEGVFATPPEIIINFSVQHTMVGITLTFDSTDSPPAQLTALAYTGDTLTSTTTITEITNPMRWELLLTDADKLIIRFDKTANPHGRARLNRLEFGMGYSFEASSIISITERRIGSPIAAELPQNTLDITLSNAEQRWNLDGDTALIRFVRDGQPISVTYGMDVDAGIEWIPSNGWQLSTCSANRTQMQFKCVSAAIAALNAEAFERCPYNSANIGPRNLYAAAELVLADAGWTSYWLNPALADIPLAVPLPMLPHAQLLQLIAGAAGMQMSVDRYGVICIDGMLKSPEIEAADNINVPTPYSVPMSTNSIGNISYADYSADFFRFDGTQRLLPDEGSLPAGWIGNALSQEDGSFYPDTTHAHENPALRYIFDAPTNVQTITLDFGGCIPYKITVSDNLAGLAPRHDFFPTQNVETFDINWTHAAALRIEWIQMRGGDQRPRLERITISPICNLDITRADIKGDITSQLCIRARNVICTVPHYILDWERPADGGAGHEKYTEYFNGTLPTGIWQRIEHGDTPIYDGYIYSVDNGITAQIQSYAYVTYLLLTGAASSASVVLYGVKTVRAASTYTCSVYDTGEDCEIDNPLIGSATALQPVANYLRQRVKYAIDTRGFPELDALDVIRIDGDSCCTMDTTLIYNGAFNGSHTFRRWESYGVDGT